MRATLFILVLALTASTATVSFGQAVRLGPDEQTMKNVLSLPYAFYNENSEEGFRFQMMVSQPFQF